MDETQRASAEWMRDRLVNGEASPAVVRATLMRVPADQRDAWLDLLLGLEGLPDDGPALPRGCVPYLPCPVDALLRMVDRAGVQASDVFVDIGAGVGRAAVLVHLLTGAAAIGLEIQPGLVHTARAMKARLNLPGYSPVEGDAAQLAGSVTLGSVFFLYCPFSGKRLEQLLDELEALARIRPIRICCVDLPLPPRPWLTPVTPQCEDLTIYRSAPIA